MEKSFIDITDSLSKYSEEHIQQKFFSACFALNIPFAFWRLPGSTDKNFITQFSSKLLDEKLIITNEKSGFAISPFLNLDNQQTVLIKPDFHYNLKTQLTSISSDEENKIKEQFLNAILSDTFSLVDLNKLPLINIYQEDKNHYVNIVNLAKNRINENDFKKVVLARQKLIDVKNNFNSIVAFNHLCQEHESALISLFFIPGKGLWLGASPEILLSINKDKNFKTSALAGTQKLCKEESLSKANWTQKEIEEQALVSRYIINCFKTIRLREYEEDGPKTVRAGNLVHLKTDFSVDMKSAGFPELGTQMLDLLHPTSAVCGMPKEPAMQFIKDHEGVDRKYFSGFIGPVNMNEETNIYVNIRCAEIGKNKAIVYSGAGITGESNAERELEETELKMKTMENILIEERFNN
jgi:isochorismate synthase